ncbi:putative metal-dependent HD superfamily phosphohydrolase [Chitinivorax tropicus]|uniref:Putative metal-dependent HD superfamily phosphohydrolase n=1 Tax=Chitinivorax tropicus TaxID=714531 RepID=A0A840MV17_9PROT|nr:hypothetical protein [Chitinivorax tropicus]MBB5020196.1 putative metal-dependent HD superfamily phosphohydrolase [Chitinivorax tropicus]
MSPSATAEDPWAARWQALWLRLGCQPDLAEYQTLRQAYAEPARHYHTFTHIAACLSWLDRAYADQALPVDDGLELAIWYHDGVYDPYRADNEAASAAWWRQTAARHGLAGPLVERVSAWILATQHADQTQPDAPWLLDIDLSILGAVPAVYQQFEQHVRAEYRWVPAFVFRCKRAALLQQFLDRPRLYQTDYFHDRLEAAARHNLQHAITALCG